MNASHPPQLRQKLTAPQKQARRIVVVATIALLLLFTVKLYFLNRWQNPAAM